MLKKREIQDKSFTAYLDHSANKGFYKFIHEYLKPTYEVEDFDVYEMIKTSYSDALFFMDNFLTQPYELDAYFIKKFKEYEFLSTKKLLINICQFYFFEEIITALTTNILLNDEADFIVDENLYHPVLGGRFNFISKTRKHTGRLDKELKPIDNNFYEYWFMDTVIDALYGYAAIDSLHAAPVIAFKKYVNKEVFPLDSLGVNQTQKQAPVIQKPQWFPLGVAFAKGDIQKKHKIGTSARDLAKHYKRPNLHNYISSTLSTQLNDRNFYNSLPKLKAIYIFCIENNILVCDEFRLNYNKMITQTKAYN